MLNHVPVKYLIVAVVFSILCNLSSRLSSGPRFVASSTDVCWWGQNRSHQCLKGKDMYPNRPRTSYVATELKPSSVATNTARSLCSDRAPAKLGRYVATELKPSSVTT
ncbi:hypothetical protein F2Q69_00006312 [Brassica cretica]|uniref:Secreted protein n=1 Tax=Brassica cretica TaxID=69181 RepID=A0A8S9NZ19_BRACR|nr:hypothetical protein F2Q69_00006312 [Brassica cretica]